MGKVKLFRLPSTVCLNLDLVVGELLCWSLGLPQRFSQYLRVIVQVIVLQWLPDCVQEGLEPVHGPPGPQPGLKSVCLLPSVPGGPDSSGSLGV